jgi:hypothetical protein
MPGGRPAYTSLGRPEGSMERRLRRWRRNSPVGIDGVLHLVGGLADLVLDRAAGPVDLALVLEVVIVGEITGGFLARPFISSNLPSPIRSSRLG